jgi:hypothetical protein
MNLFLRIGLPVLGLVLVLGGGYAFYAQNQQLAHVRNDLASTTAQAAQLQENLATTTAARDQLAESLYMSSTRTRRSRARSMSSAAR